MTRKWLLVFSIATLAFASIAVARQASYLLVTPDEVLASENAPEEEFERAVPDPYAPTIGVVRPTLTAEEFKAPVDIELKFETVDGAEIDLDTLKIQYGSLRIDVTDRVTEHATITSEGLVSENADLPKGKHKLTVSIADSEGRVGRKQFRFRIVD